MKDWLYPLSGGLICGTIPLTMVAFASGFTFTGIIFGILSLSFFYYLEKHKSY